MIPASLYHGVFLYTVIILTFVSLSKVKSIGYNQIIRGQDNYVPALIVSLIMAIWLGMRPISGYYFGDTSNYAHTYELFQSGYMAKPEDAGEWVWVKFMFVCSQVMDVNGFFTLVDLGYFGFTLWACRRLTPNNVMVSLLFVMGAFSFYTYGVNGIRNGLACSIVLLIFSYANGNKRDLIIAGLLSFFVINIHRTTMLPIALMVASLWCVKTFKTAYTFWILSIVISLVAGGAVTAFFSALGFDDRLSYLSSLDEDKFSNIGFRWDFLLYSMMPIVLGYYVVIKRGIQDKTYLMLLNTYTFANAFWVMVIRANYSNRFAYLSWFMYPLVLAYPLLRLDIWGPDQGRRLNQIMLAHVGFTWFMSTFYWS